MKKMKKLSSNLGWKDLPADILVMIFSRLDKGTTLFRTVYSVCQWWRSVSRLMAFRKGDGFLDFGVFKLIPVDQTHQFMKLLNVTVDELQSKSQSVSRIDFPEFLYLSEDHLSYLAQRLPKLQSVDLPYTTTITPAGFSRAIRFWKEIRVLNIGPIKSSYYMDVIKELGINCKNLEFLMISSTNRKMDEEDDNPLVLDEYTSEKIAYSLCQLKTLYLRDCLLHKLGLQNIMSKCTGLEKIAVLSCKHASSLMFHPPLEGYASYILKKRTIEDNTVEWSISLNKRGRGDAYFSIPYVLSFLW